MFASPIRPRTMTKEWQEASEEYLKVRTTNAAAAAAAVVYLTECTLTPYSPRAPSPLPATRVCWSSRLPSRTFLRSTSPRRSKAVRNIKTHTKPIPTPLFLESTFPLVLPVSDKQQDREVSSCYWPGHCHISSSMYRNSRGICDFAFPSPLRSCVRHNVRTTVSNLYASLCCCFAYLARPNVQLV